MKRHILWILAIILIGVCGIMNGCKDPSSLPDQENGRNLLVKDEMSKYQIVLSSEAEASEVTAANELKKYIKSISGCSLEITDDTSAPSGHEIVIGQTARDVYLSLIHILPKGKWCMHLERGTPICLQRKFFTEQAVLYAYTRF